MEENNHTKVDRLYSEVRTVILTAKNYVYKTVNFAGILSNWETGRLIVTEEQNGVKKADYGKYIIHQLSDRLTKEFGSGYNVTHLKYCRQFYLTFPFSHAVRDQSKGDDKQYGRIGHAVRDRLQSSDIKDNIIHHAMHDNSHPVYNILAPGLTWTHYRLLLKVKMRMQENST